jgi:hypothetical protein
MLTPPTAFPICTIANTPRLPEHCIEWASILEWPRIFKGGLSRGERAFRTEQYADFSRLAQTRRLTTTTRIIFNGCTIRRGLARSSTTSRASLGVLRKVSSSASSPPSLPPTLSSPVRSLLVLVLVLGVSQPSVERLPLASSSSRAAACCNEAFKIATSTNPYLSNYMSAPPTRFLPGQN